MLGQYISPSGIMLQEVCRDWEECIDRGARPLLEHGIVLPSYPAAVKRNHREMGAYMVIAPGIMLSHARPEDGAEAAPVPAADEEGAEPSAQAQEDGA